MRQGDDAPLDLGVVGTADEPAQNAPDEPPRGSGRWRWAVPAATFAVGGALGLVVADTRDDAAGYADVRLVSGLVHSFSAQADASSPGHIEVSLLNHGEHEVEILGLEPPGMTVRPGDRPAEPVAAPPGEWVAVSQTGLVADCSIEEPGDRMRVRVRDGAGTERVVDAGALPDMGGTADAWTAACAAPQLAFQVAGPASAVHDADTVTLEVHVSNPGGSPVRVVQFGSETPGLAVVPEELPFDLTVNDAVPVSMTWSVVDCEAARAWPDVVLDYTVERDGERASGAQLLPGPARAELVLLVGRVCGTGP